MREDKIWFLNNYSPLAYHDWEETDFGKFGSLEGTEFWPWLTLVLLHIKIERRQDLRKLVLESRQDLVINKYSTLANQDWEETGFGKVGSLKGTESGAWLTLVLFHKNLEETGFEKVDSWEETGFEKVDSWEETGFRS